MAFKRSAVRSRLSPPKKHRFQMKSMFFLYFPACFVLGVFTLDNKWTTDLLNFFFSSYCGKEEVMASVKEEIITPDFPSPGARLSFTPDIFSASSCGRWPPAGRLLMPEVGLFKLRRICYTKYLGKTFALRGVR